MNKEKDATTVDDVLDYYLISSAEKGRDTHRCVVALARLARGWNARKCRRSHRKRSDAKARPLRYINRVPRHLPVPPLPLRGPKSQQYGFVLTSYHFLRIINGALPPSEKVALCDPILIIQPLSKK